MEEKRFDPYQFIGFVLIALILTWMLYVNRPDEVVSPEVKQSSTESINEQVQPALTKLNDSLNRISIETTYGIFSNWMTNNGAKKQELENKEQEFRAD